MRAPPFYLEGVHICGVLLKNSFGTSESCRPPRSSERLSRQPASAWPRPRSVMTWGLRKLVAGLVVFSVAAFVSQSTRAQAQTQSDPAAIVHSQQKLSAALTEKWLTSNDSRVRAWGAYLAMRDHQFYLHNELIGLAMAYHVTGLPLTAEERDEHDAMIAVLDAIIQLGTSIPPEVAGRLYPEFPAQALILLSSQGQFADRNLLEIFKTENRQPGAWLAAGNLLMMSRPAGFAAAVLAGLTVHAHVTVVSPTGGGGLGGGSWGSCGSSIPPDKKDWPPVGNYFVVNSGPVNGSILLAAGADSAFYVRKVDAAYFDSNSDQRPCVTMSDMNRDVLREHFLAELAAEPLANPSVQSYVVQTITWYDDATYLKDLQAFINHQQVLFDKLTEKLMDAKLLTADERDSARPILEARVCDYRKNSPQELPILRDQGGNVKIIN